MYGVCTAFCTINLYCGAGVDYSSQHGVVDCRQFEHKDGVTTEQSNDPQGELILGSNRGGDRVSVTERQRRAARRVQLLDRKEEMKNIVAGHRDSKATEQMPWSAVGADTA